ncbi:MAG: glycine--tRNA ligase [Thermoplasmata archaeon]
MAEKDDLESLCKRRGFVWPSSDIYGGEAGFYDYGHLGARLKDNWERAWKDYFLGLGDNYHMIYTPNILPYRVLESSGHVDHFSDVLIRCTKCGNSHRGDHLLEDITGESAEWMDKEEIESFIRDENVTCPDCGGELDEPMDFNMMFGLNIGPTGERKGFLRPETAQGTYMNFHREHIALRRKLPFGLATIGSAFRNEISPRQGVYRLREFQQAELQIFFIPDSKDFDHRYDALGGRKIPLLRADWNKARNIPLKELEDLPKFYKYHMAKMFEFYKDKMELNVRLRELSEEERAFYNRIHFDVEAKIDSIGGWKEVAGLHYRGDYDLAQHQQASGQRMSVSIDGEKKIPHVMELSFGVDRNVWSLLDQGYKTGDRDWISFPRYIAPYQVAVFPLVRKDGLLERSREIYEFLNSDFYAFWDKSGSIGKRYARQDEIGTPFCITVDYDTPEDDTVTLREISSTDQIRLKVSNLKTELKSYINKEKKFET